MTKQKKQNIVVIILGVGLLLIIGSFLLYKYQNEKPVRIIKEEPKPERNTEPETEVNDETPADINKSGDDEQPS